MVRRIDESDKNRKSVKEARIGRTKEVKVLQGNWGSGWDDLCEYDKYDNGECKNDLKAYRENDPSASYRVIFRRVPNKDYVPTESIKKKNSKSLGESVSDKLELQEIANAINALNDDRSWVELDASVQKRENQRSKFKYVCRVMVTNHSYTNVTDEYRIVQAHRGGFVIHYDNPIGSEWIADKQKVIDYFEEMVVSNIEEDF